MARNISMEPDAPVYRAIVKIHNTALGFSDTKYEGPYSQAGTAKARVTFWKNYMANRDGVYVTGWVEKGETEWNPYE